ncbi:MAG: U32 family peptidase, partial [Clostridia bacterium]|nr:U32 family peptidase [Clostridia bacterium]
LELLAPAGNQKNFFAAVNNGADAVYLGMDDFSARKSAENFNSDNIGYFVSYAHALGVKVYVAMNTLIKNSELDYFFKTAATVYEAGADAVILQDVFFGEEFKKRFPEMQLHLSTQAGVNNLLSAKFAVNAGFDRVIAARETAIGEIKEIAALTDTEVFVQGAMCSCFSGHCYMSSFIGGNSGNRGFCKQPCRQKYSFSGEKETRYAISLSDLCLIDRLSELESAGVKSIKIEGRMRSEEYVAASVKAYRAAIDKKPYDTEEIKRVYNRGNFTSGYPFGVDGGIISDKIQNHSGVKVGVVKRVFKDKIEVSSGAEFSRGDCFKIIREGKEVANATCLEKGKFLAYKGSALIGDEVNFTKDSALVESLIAAPKRTKAISVSGEFVAGKRAFLTACGVTVYTDEPLLSAKTAPLSEEEVKSNLNKTDIFPFAVMESNINVEGEPFIRKSDLNKLRLKLYESIFYGNEKRRIIAYDKPDFAINYVKRKYGDIILTDRLNLGGATGEDALVYFPVDYEKIDYTKVEELKRQVKGIYLYVPAFFNSSDEKIIISAVKKFDGIYADGLSGLALAENLNAKVIAGTGLNAFNDYDFYYLNKKCEAVVYSKELSLKEIGDDCENFWYIFTFGAVRLMELVYCPYKRRCATCKVGECDFLTDEGGRKFVLRRYKIGDKCRFEIYNSAKLEYSKMPHNFFNFMNFYDNIHNGDKRGASLAVTRGALKRGVN